MIDEDVESGSVIVFHMKKYVVFADHQLSVHQENMRELLLLRKEHPHLSRQWSRWVLEFAFRIGSQRNNDTADR